VLGLVPIMEPADAQGF